MTRIITATILLAVLLVVFGAGCAHNPKVQWVGVEKTVKDGVQYPAKSSGISATVRWNPSAGATGYRVYHTPELTQPMALAGETGETNLTLTGLPFGQSYFRVTATNIYGESK